MKMILLFVVLLASASWAQESLPMSAVDVSSVLARLSAVKSMVKQPDPVANKVSTESLDELEAMLDAAANRDVFRDAVLSLVTACARAGNVEAFRRFVPFCDETARRDVAFNLALKEGGDLALERKDYFAALQFYRAVKRSEELMPEDLAGSDYDLDLMLRLATCYDAMGRRWASHAIYEHVIEAFPESPEVERCRYGIFECLMALKELELAKAAGQAYVTHYPTGEFLDSVTLGQMRLTLTLNGPAAAVEFGHALREQVPEHRELDQVTSLLGSIAFQMKEYEKALLLFEEVAARWPDRLSAEDSVYWAGMCLLFQGRYEDAITKFKSYLSSPARPVKKFEADVMYRLGMARYGLEEYEAAEEIFEAFPSQFPMSDLCAEAYSMLGDLKGADGNLEQALQAYEKARLCAANLDQENYAVFRMAEILELLDRDEEVVPLMKSYLQAWGEEGRFAEASLWMSKALRATGDEKMALNVACATLVNYGDDLQAKGLDRVVEELIAVACDPEKGAVQASKIEERLVPIRERLLAEGGATVLRLRLTALLARISNGEKRAGYEAALLAESDFSNFSPLPLMVFAEAATRQSEPDRAQQAVDYFLETFAESDLALRMVNLQVEAWIGQKNYEKALALAQEALTRYSKNSDAGQTQKLAADALRLMGRYEEAIQMYDHLLTVREWRGSLTPQVLYWMGFCTLEQGNPRRAYAYFQRIYVLYTQYPEWTAKGYAGTIQCLQRLGGRQAGVIRTWQEMVSIPEVAATPEGRKAQAQLDALQKETR